MTTITVHIFYSLKVETSVNWAIETFVVFSISKLVRVYLTILL